MHDPLSKTSSIFLFDSIFWIARADTVGMVYRRCVYREMDLPRDVPVASVYQTWAGGSLFSRADWKTLGFKIFRFGSWDLGPISN